MGKCVGLVNNSQWILKICMFKTEGVYNNLCNLVAIPASQHRFSTNPDNAIINN